jgi:hypothetical protein
VFPFVSDETKGHSQADKAGKDWKLTEDQGSYMVIGVERESAKTAMVMQLAVADFSIVSASRHVGLSVGECMFWRG